MNQPSTYDVTVTEFYEKTIQVKATSPDDAASIASTMWNNNDQLLDSPPFMGVKYAVRKTD